jgi:hypothetical protein
VKQANVKFKHVPFKGGAPATTALIGGHVDFTAGAGIHVNYVKQGIFQAGATPVEFGTIAACDGIAQGHDGMHYILPTRDLIANDIEMMIGAHRLDGVVLLAPATRSSQACSWPRRAWTFQRSWFPGGPWKEAASLMDGRRTSPERLPGPPGGGPGDLPRGAHADAPGGRGRDLGLFSRAVNRLQDLGFKRVEHSLQVWRDESGKSLVNGVLGVLHVSCELLDALEHVS